MKGETAETEDAKKSALTGADVVIIPAGVPRTALTFHLLELAFADIDCRKAWYDPR